MPKGAIRHMDNFARLKPEYISKLRHLLSIKSMTAVAKMLRTSQVTIESISDPLGGARKETIDRIEEALKEVG